MAKTELSGAEDVLWDLSYLYASGDDPRIDEDVAEAEAAAAVFRERYHEHVAELSAGELAAAVEECERIHAIFTRAIYYAHLWYSTDMADAPRGALLARLTEKGAMLDTQLLFFGLAMLGVAIVFAWGASTSLTRPLGTLTRAARRIAGGDLSQPIPALPEDETGQLGAAFERMRQALRESLKEHAHIRADVKRMNEF